MFCWKMCAPLINFFDEKCPPFQENHSSITDSALLIVLFTLFKYIWSIIRHLDTVVPLQKRWIGNFYIQI